MRASRAALWFTILIVTGLSGCYGRYVGPAPYLPGLDACYGASAGPFGGCPGYGLYGEGYGPYGDYWGGPGLHHGYGHGYGGFHGGEFTRERLRLRERIRGRGDHRLSRRFRVSRHWRGSLPYGDLPYNPCLDCDGCGGEPWMECDPCWQDPGCCDGLGGSGVIYDGMAPGWSAPSPIQEFPSGTCAGGSCGVQDPNWGLSVPYSHEVPPTDSIPQPIPQTIPQPFRSPDKREPYLAPPAQLPTVPPEGDFRAPPNSNNNNNGFSSNGFTSRTERMSPNRHRRLVPAAF